MDERETVLEQNKATLCRGAAFGVAPYHVLDLKIENGPYAQHARAFHVTYRRPRKHKREGFVCLNDGFLVVLKDFVPIGSITVDPFDATIGGSISRYGCFDARYVEEFRAGLALHLEEHADELVFDAWTPGFE